MKLDENPAFFTSLRERLEQLIADWKAKRIDAAQQLTLFEALTKDLKGPAGAAERLGLTETGFAIYGILRGPAQLRVADPNRASYGAHEPYATPVDEAKTELASLLEEQLAPQVAIVDWTNKDDVQREMRKVIKRQLRAASYAKETIDATADGVVDVLKRRSGR